MVVIVVVVEVDSDEIEHVSQERNIYLPTQMDTYMLADE